MQQRQLTVRKPTPKRDAPQVLGLHTELLIGKTGKVIAALDALNDTLHNAIDLPFPQVVVIGEESSGKSSVLERIAMAQLFPRDPGICTRMPIELRLKHLSKPALQAFCNTHSLDFNEDQAYVRLGFEGKDGARVYSTFFNMDQVEQEVKKHMDQAVMLRNGASPKGHVWGVTSDVLTIEITSYHVPNLTLVDLPGLVGGHIAGEPPNIVEQTTSLAEHYLQQPHIMVLLVVPAFQRIRNSRACGLVQKYRKELHTIGVLTMADRAYENIRANDPYYSLKMRLDKKADDCIELTNGYIAVKNRDKDLNANEVLSNSANQETPWFEQNLPGYIEQEKASGAVLIKKLSAMLCNYVIQTWIPSTRAKITQEIQQVDASITNLGPNPTVDSLNLLQTVLTQSRTDWVAGIGDATARATGVFGANEKISTVTAAIARCFSSVLSDNISVDDHSLFVTKNRKASMQRLREAGLASVSAVMEVVRAKVSSLFQNNKAPLYIARFTNLCTAVVARLTTEFESTWKNTAINRIKTELTYAFAAATFAGNAAPKSGIERLTTTIIMEEVVLPANDFLCNTSGLSSALLAASSIEQLLKESEEVATRRASMNARKQTLQAALHEMAELQAIYTDNN